MIGIGSGGYGGQEVPDLPSARWRMRRAGVVAQPESKGLSTGGQWWVAAPEGLRTRSSDD